ncbi:MAG: type II toxin-antitoxin system PemK/MazF family toxin [Bacilli bacterium]|nr:type II toxin-antitoxin system PemK/MazF family toxin [Bacilli bacterium]
MNTINKGDIYYASLDPIVGSEQNGTRPVVIIQNDIGNKYSPTVLVAPLTSKVKSKHNLPTHVLVKSERIKHNSIVLLEQIRVLDKSRLISYVDTLTKEEIKKLDIGIIKSFNITGECFNDANILF